MPSPRAPRYLAAVWLVLLGCYAVAAARRALDCVQRRLFVAGAAACQWRSSGQRHHARLAEECLLDVTGTRLDAVARRTMRGDVHRGVSAPARPRRVPRR